MSRNTFLKWLLLTMIALVIAFIFLQTSTSTEPSQWLPFSLSKDHSRATTPANNAGDNADDIDDDNDPWIMTEVTYIKRRQLAENACLRNQREDGRIRYLMRYVTSERMTSYCPVPKVAFSFWLSVLRFLSNDTDGQRFPSPFDIPRYLVHYAPHRKLKVYTNVSVAADDFRFMFVREPYSRLWSAYVDKFFLPDFWKSAAKAITKVRSNSTTWKEIRVAYVGQGQTEWQGQDGDQGQNNSQGQGHNGSFSKKPNSSVCGSDISFKEFAEFVAFHAHPKDLNPHWKPVHYMCSPCLYRPHLIGKLETFSEDVAAVLKVMNASWILEESHKDHLKGHRNDNDRGNDRPKDHNGSLNDNDRGNDRPEDHNGSLNDNDRGNDRPKDHTPSPSESSEESKREHDLNEVKQLIDYNFAILERGSRGKCLTAHQLVSLLWQAFQINGYIQEDRPIPQLGKADWTRRRFTEVVHNAMLQARGRTKAEWREQRRRVMVRAYKTLTLETLEKLSEVYRDDFDMYGYDPRPSFLFADTSI